MSLPNGITRTELYLKAIAATLMSEDNDQELPNAITRIDNYLKDIAENVSGGGGGAWSEAGHVTGSTGINIGSVFSEASEFAILIKADNNTDNCLVITIPKNVITDGVTRISVGGDSNMALVTLSDSAITTTYVKWTTDVTSTSVTTVYYK